MQGSYLRKWCSFMSFNGERVLLCLYKINIGNLVMVWKNLLCFQKFHKMVSFRYMFAVDGEENVVAMAHFRFDTDDDIEVLYWWDVLQWEK